MTGEGIYYNGLYSGKPEAKQSCCMVGGGTAEYKSDGDCPDCGSKIHPEGGCLICQSCGWSKCS